MIAVSLVYGCGDPAKMVPASDGSNEPGTDGPTADTHIDANTTLSPDPLDPVSTPCTGGLRFPGLPTLVNDSSPHFAMADVDGDGHQDVVSWSSVGIRTRRGLGNGMFLAPTVTSAASSATVFTIADTTGDGRPDLVYAVGTDTNIRVAANNGSGGFGAPLLYDVGLLATSVRAVDVNGDGKRDLVAFARGSGNVAVRMNTGTGFGPRALYNVGGQLTMGFELADLTNDGRPEIVAADLGASTVGVLLNDGSGVFMPRISYPAPSSPTAVAIADMNEDGKLDVVTGTNGTATEVRVSVLLNLGGGVLGAAQNFPTGAHGYPPNVVAVADVNGDGHVDVATSATDVTAQILFGSGTGQLASP